MTCPKTYQSRSGNNSNNLVIVEIEIKQEMMEVNNLHMSLVYLKIMRTEGKERMEKEQSTVGHRLCQPDQCSETY